LTDYHITGIQDGVAVRILKRKCRLGA